MADGPTEDAGAQSPAHEQPIDPPADSARTDFIPGFPGRPSAPTGGGVLRGIDWRATFPFVNLFRGFRVAIHPSKLLLALAAILILYTIGRSLDGMWATSAKAYPGEVESFEVASARGTLRGYGAERARLKAESRAAYDALRTEAGATGSVSFGLGEVKAYLIKQRTAAVAAADKRYAAAQVAKRPAGQAKAIRADEIGAAYRSAEARYAAVKFADGRGPFIVFYDYESDQLNVAAAAVLGADPYYAAGAAVRFVFVGPAWLMFIHPLYFVLFSTLSLVVVAIFGGAISRIAAVHVARDEKISVRQSLKFSAAKFLSFLSAPLVPAVVFIGVGLAVAVAGLIAAIPYVGPIVVGAGFFLALLAGLLMTLILIGTLGGFGMMYPTIAAEGSDSFDAISRSFSYLYARPWRFIFYTLVSLVYGALTFLFVKLFLYLVIRLALASAGALLFFRTAADGSNLISALAPGPATPLNLTYDIPFLSLNGGQDVGAFLISFWIYLVVGLSAAFVMSLYFSLNTIIYFLMRAEVDATDPDEVYLEPGEDEFADTIDPLEPAEPLAASQSEPASPAPQGKVVEVGATPTEPEPPMPDPTTDPTPDADVPQVEPGHPMADRTTDPEPADMDDSTPMVDPEAPEDKP